MGNECFSSTPNQCYGIFLYNLAGQYLASINVGELKDLWETSKLYKIKKIYQSYAKPLPDDKSKNHIPYEQFTEMFPEFDRYEQINKRRLFQIFDFQNQGYLDWNNFFTTISICYFASQSILSVFMFIIFDQALAKDLTRHQLMLLIDLNSFAIKKSLQNNSQVDVEQITNAIIREKTSIQINQWVQISKYYFDFSKYRRLFNIFKEQKLQKQLIGNFNQWNELFNQQSQKYISYIVCYKWFQAWRIYVQDNYGVTVNINPSRQATARTLKTRQNFAKRSIKTMKKIASSKTLKFIEDFEENDGNKQNLIQQSEKYSPKNIDFIHNNIGQRPKQIYNNVLEGQFQEVLKSELVQNRDYVLVSQTVWNSLKQIYGGGPQFRRTGFDSIQLYPKIVKIYSSLFKNQIDYSSQVMRQVSGYLTIEELLMRSIDLTQEDLARKKLYYKTIGMIKWEQITELDYMFLELTSDIVIFLIYIQKQEEEAFKKLHTRMAKEIGQINAGDFVKFIDLETKVQKQAIFMGKNVEGKYILHFPKQSYSLDKCLVQSDVIKCCKLYKPENVVNDVKLKNKYDQQIKGISNSKGLGFVNSMILNLFNNKTIKNMFSMINSEKEESKLVYYLMDVCQSLSQKKKVDSRDIYDMIELFLPRYQNFEVSMSQQFLRSFFSHLIFQLDQIQMNKKIQQSLKIEIKSVKKCLKCQTEQKEDIEDYCITIPLPIQKQSIYQIVFVPICVGLRSSEIRKYGITLPKEATLKHLKDEFEKVCELDKKRPYILTQIFSNRIIKNYNSVELSTPLQKLKLRAGDSLYAFELYVDFHKFISNHYSATKTLTQKDTKVDNFIDCKHIEKGWIFGKVCQIQYLPYTQQTLVKILHKFSKDQQWEVKYDFTEQTIAKYPSKCYLNAQQYHIQVIQRYFNESVNQMQICNMPLVVVLTSWMRWKQFKYLVYLQLKRFVSPAYGFQDLNQGDQQQLEDIRLTSTKDIKSSKKIANSIKTNKFKQYLNGKNFPYNIHLIDTEGRCAICFKFLKTKIFKGESQSYCQGCNLSQSQPISWQIKIVDVMVTIDWKDLNSFQNKIVSQHSSLINLTNKKKVITENLVNCIKNRFDPSIQEEQLLCCNTPEKVQTKQQIQNSPQIIPIFLSRIIEQQDGYKMINTQQISYPLRNLILGKSSYNLTGLTSIQGNSKNIKYKTYISRQKVEGTLNPTKNVDSIQKENTQEWIQYDGQYAKIVNQKIVQKACALVLFYKKNKK